MFARIEAVGRESLTELRRMLGVLRETGDDGASLSPQPGIADIAAAVAQSSADRRGRPNWSSRDASDRSPPASS